MAVKIHKGNNVAGISFGFLKNAAVFTAEKGLALGDFYKVSVPFHTLYVITSPDLIRKAFVTNGDKYRKSRIYWKQLKAVTGKSIGTLEGKEWTELKSLEQQFYKPAAIQAYLAQLDSVIDSHIAQWKSIRPANQVYNISKLLSLLNLEVILKSVFGINDDSNLDELARAIEDGENNIAWRSKYPWRPVSGWLTGQNYKAKKGLNVFEKFVQKNLPLAEPGSLTTILYQSLPAHLTEKEKTRRIRNELIVHLGAGTETAAVSLAWTLHLLTQHPDILARLKREIDNFQVSEENKLNFSLSKLPYLQQVVEESLRLFPPSHAIIRDCAGEDEIAGQKIRKDDIVYASVYALHRNPRLWEAPEKFNPDRFSPDLKSKIPDYAYIPFGVGKHTCIGRYLAIPMLLTTLYKILLNFDLAPTSSGMLKPVTLSTLKPEKEVEVIMKIRS